MSVLSDKQAATSIAWLKAFGIQAVTVCGPKSTEFWKPYAEPGKFEGLLPVLWREDDVTIYRVPQRNTSLAHVIPESAVARGVPYQNLAPAELEKYVATLEDVRLPEAEMRWEGFRKIRIRTVANAGQAVSVQTSYHRGWHARANGRAAEVSRDGLGFLLLRPGCDGACEIELDYDGGWEYQLCRWLSALAMVGVAAFYSARRSCESSFKE